MEMLFFIKFTKHNYDVLKSTRCVVAAAPSLCGVLIPPICNLQSGKWPRDSLLVPLSLPLYCLYYLSPILAPPGHNFGWEDGLLRGRGRRGRLPEALGTR